MSRRSERRAERQSEALIKAVMGIALMAFFSVKLIPGLAERLISIGYLVASIAALGLACATIFVAIRYFARRNAAPPEIVYNDLHGATSGFIATPSSLGPIAPVQGWPTDRIRLELGEIDWYQFERFCAALLKAEGCDVERKGGAQPDGGVDLVAHREGRTTLVQCKHWKTWTVQEKTVRELLGSMTHFKVDSGALYTLNTWTRPAERLAAEHSIDLVNGDELATRAKNALSDSQLNELLDSSVHHCPRCEAHMVLRTGNFKPFWGCSTFPRCRGTLKNSGAR